MIRLGPADAAELHAYLVIKDVRPCPSADDLVEFLGRTDAAVFAMRSNGFEATVAGALDGHTLHVQWLYVEDASRDSTRALIDALASFGRARGAMVLYAQTAESGPAQAALRENGFVEDAREGDVVQDQPSWTVSLVKVLAL